MTPTKIQNVLAAPTPPQDLRQLIKARLIAGDDPAVVAKDLGLSTVDDSHSDDTSWDGLAIVLPGWIADDGNAEVEYPYADSADEAAREYAADGDWGDSDSTIWIGVYAWRVALVLRRCDDDDYDPPAPGATAPYLEEVQVDRERHTVEIEPDEPDCEDEPEHEWCSPYEVVGGCETNPGVRGHGGGVIVTELCRHCGRYRVTDTWAQRSDTGEQGLTSVTYRDADDASREWIESHA
jgi:hypothetical protein